MADTLWLELASTAMATIGWKYYLVFLCLGVVHTIYLYFRLPEVSLTLVEYLSTASGNVELTHHLFRRLLDLRWKRSMPCSERK